MLLKSKNTLRHFFMIYSYCINLFLTLIDFFPHFIRDPFFKFVLLKIGRNVFIDYGVYFRFPKKISIGNEVTVGRGVSFFPSYHEKNSKILIGSNVRIAPGVSFIAAGHDYNFLSLPDVGGDIVVADNVWLGANSVLLPGVVIGEGAVVAAGSVVTKNVEPYTIVGGVPAKKIKNRLISDE